MTEFITAIAFFLCIFCGVMLIFSAIRYHNYMRTGEEQWGITSKQIIPLIIIFSALLTYCILVN
jgi:cell division protein FtsW (lipid II flippase)